MKNMENKNGPEIYIGGNTNTDQKGNSYLKEMETAAGENRLEAYYQNEKNKLTARLKHSVDSEDKELSDSILRDISALEEAYRIINKGGNSKKNIIKICPKCGIEYENSAKFCRNCGHELVLMQCACGEVFLKHEDGSFDKYCMKCGKLNPLEQAKQDLAGKHSEYINNLKSSDIIKFGSYTFETDGTKKPIEWIILERYSDDTALLLSKYGLDAVRFDKSSNNWEESEIRAWLNDSFYNNAFDKKERVNIIESNVECEKEVFGWTRNYTVTDKIFLLSTEEVSKYFSSDKERMCRPTPWVCTNKTVTGEPVSSNGSCCWWWLRSPGSYQSRAACVDIGGNIWASGGGVYDGGTAVRVALKINLNNL